MLKTHGDAEDWISVGKVSRAVQWIDIPAIVAALIIEPLLFAQNVVGWPVLMDALANQHLRGTVRGGNQVGFALVFDFQMLMEIAHQQRAGFARDGGHGGEK